MSALLERRDPFAAAPVSLAPISDEQQVDENLEPPFVRVRDGNESFIYADSEARSDFSNPVSYTLGGGNFQFYARKLKRIAAEGTQLALCIPNINPRNNVVLFFSTVTGLTHTATIPEGHYNTVAAGVAALVAALNAAVPPSGLVFAGVINPLNGRQFTLTAVGGLYHFIVGNPLSTMMTRGRYLFNLPIDQTDTAAKTVGAVYLAYTRHFDILSNSFVEYSKNPACSNSRMPNSQIARVFLKSPTSPPGGLLTPTDDLSFNVYVNSASTNYNRGRALEVLDISLIDEFGMPLYVPALSTGTPANMMLDLIIKTEL
jgi:hypothetical protein